MLLRRSTLPSNHTQPPISVAYPTGVPRTHPSPPLSFLTPGRQQSVQLWTCSLPPNRRPIPPPKPPAPIQHGQRFLRCLGSRLGTRMKRPREETLKSSQPASSSTSRDRVSADRLPFSARHWCTQYPVLRTTIHCTYMHSALRG